MCLSARATYMRVYYLYVVHDERGRITRYNARWRRKEQGPKYMHKACPNKSLSVSLGRKKQMVSLSESKPDAARSLTLAALHIIYAFCLLCHGSASARDELIVSAVRVLGFFIGHPLAQLQPLSPTFAFNWPVLFARSQDVAAPRWKRTCVALSIVTSIYETDKRYKYKVQ
jgi:hypothetical protein